MQYYVPKLLVTLFCVETLFILFFNKELTLDKQNAATTSKNNFITHHGSRGRLAKHITFYYDPKNDPRNDKRLNSLVRVLGAAEEYTPLYLVDVMVHTNRLTDDNIVFSLNDTLGYKCNLPRLNQWLCPNVTVVTHDMSGLKPHFLTWKHREYMMQQQNDFDIFLYVEDDQLFGMDQLQYFLEYSPLAKRLGCRLGYLRLLDPIHTNGTDYIYPKIKWGNILHFQKKDESVQPEQEWVFLEGERSYWAGWIMSQRDFLAFTSSPDYLPRFRSINKYKIREIAAWGWDFPWVKSQPGRATVCNGTIVPLLKIEESLVLHPGAKSYHMTDKYSPECRKGNSWLCGVVYNTFKVAALDVT